MKRKPNGYWTFDKLLKEAKKYKYKIHFHTFSASACTIAMRNPKTYRLITAHMLDGQEKKSLDKIVHTVQNVIVKAKTCKTKSEFRKKFRKECDALQQRGLLQEVFKKTTFELEDKCSSMGELSSISFLNKLLKIKLVKTKVHWLEKGRKPIEFDGMDVKRKIAFEYNGPRHTESKVKKMDLFKKKECKKRGFKLIVIHEYKRLSKYEYLLESIEKQLFKEIKRLNLPIKNKNTKLVLIPNNKGFSLQDIIHTAKQYKTRADFFKDHPKMYTFLNNTRQLHFISHLKRQRPNTHLSHKHPNKTKGKYTPSNWKD